jgi:octaprenyl-diphosphate synthase
LSGAVDPRGGGRGVADLKDIVQLVEDDLVKVEELFAQQVRSDVKLVAEIGRYIQQGGGKRIRPALLLLACRAAGYRGERAILLASVVEFIHTATLLHDDIIDEATVRRGRRSVNSRWGNDITVLLGDFLYTKSMAMALSQDNLKILRLLSDVTLRMIEGEILEIERNGDVKVTPDDHIDIIRRKTADLFSACMRIGAILGDVGPEKEEALARYGLNLGICFQMVDDLLDFTAEEETLGKPVANDLREGKLTLPMIFLLRKSGSAGLEMVRAVLDDRGFGRVSRDELVRLARDHGALDEARTLAEQYADAARRDLEGFERSRYREALEALPDFILARDH